MIQKIKLRMAFFVLLLLLGCTTGRLYEEDVNMDADESPVIKPVEAAASLYIVKDGDTLSQIAERYNKTDTFDKIVERNGITNPERIYEGQKLRIIMNEVTADSAQLNAPAAASAISPEEKLVGVCGSCGRKLGEFSVNDLLMTDSAQEEALQPPVVNAPSSSQGGSSFISEAENIYIAAISYSIDGLGYDAGRPVAFGFAPGHTDSISEDIKSHWSAELISKISKATKKPIDVVFSENVETRHTMIKSGDMKGAQTVGYYDKKSGKKITSIGVSGVTIKGDGRVYVLVNSYQGDLAGSFAKLILEKRGGKWVVVGIAGGGES